MHTTVSDTHAQGLHHKLRGSEPCRFPLAKEPFLVLTSRCNAPHCHCHCHCLADPCIVATGWVRLAGPCIVATGWVRCACQCRPRSDVSHTIETKLQRILCTRCAAEYTTPPNTLPAWRHHFFSSPVANLASCLLPPKQPGVSRDLCCAFSHCAGVLAVIEMAWIGPAISASKTPLTAR